MHAGNRKRHYPSVGGHIANPLFEANSRVSRRKRPVKSHNSRVSGAETVDGEGVRRKG